MGTKKMGAKSKKYFFETNLLASEKNFQKTSQVFPTENSFNSKWERQFSIFNFLLTKLRNGFKRRIKNPAKHLRWSVLQKKQLTAESRDSFSQNALF